MFLFSLLSLLSTISFAQEVKVKVDTTNIRIGEQFNFQITVDDTANVIIPKLENLKGLEILEDIPTDTLDRNLIKKYLLTSFDSGAYYISSQQVFIRNRAYITDSILINVATVAIDTTKQKMFPIKAIQSEPFTFDDFKPYIIWIVLALLLIAGLIYYFKTRKKKEVVEMWEIAPKFDTKGLRDQYVNGFIYKIGDIVESLHTGLIGEIVRRGTNHLICVTKENYMFKSWIRDVMEYDEKSMDGRMRDSKHPNTLVGTTGFLKNAMAATGTSSIKNFINKNKKRK